MAAACWWRHRGKMVAVRRPVAADKKINQP